MHCDWIARPEVMLPQPVRGRRSPCADRFGAICPNTVVLEHQKYFCFDDHLEHAERTRVDGLTLNSILVLLNAVTRAPD